MYVKCYTKLWWISTHGGLVNQDARLRALALARALRGLVCQLWEGLGWRREHERDL